MRDHFLRLADGLCTGLGVDEVLLLNCDGEQSDFVRFNRGRVRQSGAVQQMRLDLCLVCGDRQARGGLDLSGVLDRDLAAARAQIARLREFCAVLPADPHLNFARELQNSESVQASDLPPAGDLAEAMAREAAGLDLVGILASGDQYRGFANSLGQRNWHARRGFNFDFSCYTEQDRAVKSRLAGAQWRPEEWAGRVEGLRSQLANLRQPRQPLAPGDYRVYLAPAALAELMDLLSWGGFGLKALRTAQSPLLKLAEARVALDPRVNLREDREAGLAPGFSERGFVLPSRVELIRDGGHAGSLTDARSAREYAEPINCTQESPESLVMDGGDLPAAEVLSALDRGLYVNNLWYCNFSDRNECRITGMTRFASFWVEDGLLQAPAEVMRFDDSLYQLLGEQLIALTRETELLVDPGSYGGRELRSARLPGALIGRMHFAL